MSHIHIIDSLSHNREVFQKLLGISGKHIQQWKPKPGKWCALEIVCHLYDEEREDFRARVKHTLEHPGSPLPPIDPSGWVTGRKYMEQDYETMVSNFLNERAASIQWLRSLTSPQWKNTHQHPKFGPLSAELFLANWLAHDYLHIRQITRLQYEHLKTQSGIPLDYAGEW